MTGSPGRDARATRAGRGQPPVERFRVALQVAVELLQGTQSRDRAPREGNIYLARPSPDFEHMMWDV